MIVMNNKSTMTLWRQQRIMRYVTIKTNSLRIKTWGEDEAISMVPRCANHQ